MHVFFPRHARTGHNTFTRHTPPLDTHPNSTQVDTGRNGSVPFDDPDTIHSKALSFLLVNPALAVAYRIAFAALSDEETAEFLDVRLAETVDTSEVSYKLMAELAGQTRVSDLKKIADAIGTKKKLAIPDKVCTTSVVMACRFLRKLFPLHLFSIYPLLPCATLFSQCHRQNTHRKIEHPGAYP